MEKVDKVNEIEMDKVDKVKKVDRVDKVDKLDKVEAVANMDNMDQMDKVDNVDKVGERDRVDKIDKVNKVDKKVLKFYQNISKLTHCRRKCLNFPSATINFSILHPAAENLEILLCNKEISNFMIPKREYYYFFPCNLDEMNKVKRLDEVDKVEKVNMVDKKFSISPPAVNNFECFPYNKNN